MKKIIIMAFAILVSVAGAFAQEAAVGKVKKSAEERAEKFTKRMTKELTLDAAQQDRVKILNLERFKQIEEVKGNMATNKKEAAAKLKEVNEAYLNNLKGVLTAEQLTKFEALKEEMKEKAFQRRQERKK